MSRSAVRWNSIRIMTRPTCGSGSLLIKAADHAPNGLTIYGQENPPRTRGRRDQARQHPCRPSVHGGIRGSQTVRLRGRQSPVLRQGLDERPRPGQRRIPRYIDSSESEDLHDLGASVRIPQQRLGFPRDRAVGCEPWDEGWLTGPSWNAGGRSGGAQDSTDAVCGIS